MGSMQPIRLVVRCFAERTGSQWQAFSLDLGLAAQADTFEDAKRKLESEIMSYVREAFTVDRKYFDQLMSRRAPLWAFARYYWALTALRLRRAAPVAKVLRAARVGELRLFNEPLPLQPAGC